MSSTSDEVGHTATPWRLKQATKYDDLDPTQCHKVSGKNWDTFALVVTQVGEKPSPEGAANAAFIVRAVNSHDSLVKALEKTTDWIVALAASGDAGFWDGEKVEEVIEARAALSQAKGGK